MRRLFAISLVALLLGVGIVALIETDPGYVLIAHGNYSLETSLWVGLVLLLLLVLLLFLLLRLVYQLSGGRRSLAAWLGGQRSGASQRTTTRGVISFAEGNWLRARRHLLRGARNNDAPLVNYLLAARASDYLEERESAIEHLDAATEAESGAAAAVAMTRAEIHLRGGEYEQALGVLEPLRRHASRHPGALVLLQRAYEGTGDWTALVSLLPELRKAGGLSDEELQALEREAQGRRLRAANGAPELHAAWQGLSPELKRDAAMQRLYVGALVRQGDHEAAEKVILRGLKKNWDSQLVRQFGLLETDNTSRQLKQAEDWLQQHPEDAQLLLCLGRLCLRDKLWGKAREYFESSYRAQASAEVCAELGRLLLGLGEPKVAAAYYREGLALSEAQLPDLPMPDKVVSNHHLLERG
jgi:HemY protein